MSFVLLSDATRQRVHRQPCSAALDWFDTKRPSPLRSPSSSYRCNKIMASHQDTTSERRPKMCLSFIEDIPLYQALRDVTLGVGPASSRDPDCSICYLDFEDRDILLQHTSCGMSYHLLCVFNWLTDSSTCPLCCAELRMRELIPERSSYNEFLLAEEEESVQERRAMSHAFDFDAERRSQDLISGSDNASQAPPGEVDQRFPQSRALRPSRVFNHLYRSRPVNRGRRHG